jgi:hypothetical protein
MPIQLYIPSEIEAAKAAHTAAFEKAVSQRDKFGENSPQFPALQAIVDERFLEWYGPRVSFGQGDSPLFEALGLRDLMNAKGLICVTKLKDIRYVIAAYRPRSKRLKEKKEEVREMVTRAILAKQPIYLSI